MRTRIFTVLLTGLILFSSMTLSASDTSITKNETAVANLVTGIKSENEGLKRSAIYLSGKYAVEGTKEALIQQFKKESNPSTRLLIAQAIYRMKDDKAMELIYNMVSQDPDPKVRRIGSAIYETYKLDNYTSEEFTASIH